MAYTLRVMESATSTLACASAFCSWKRTSPLAQLCWKFRSWSLLKAVEHENDLAGGLHARKGIRLPALIIWIAASAARHQITIDGARSIVGHWSIILVDGRKCAFANLVERDQAGEFHATIVNIRLIDADRDAVGRAPHRRLNVGVGDLMPPPPR